MKRKNPMILSVLTAIHFKHNEQIKPNQVLLIDDDWNNIKIAKKGGFNVYHFNNNNENNILTNLSKSVEYFSNPTTFTFVYADACKLMIIFCVVLFLLLKDRMTTSMGTKLVTLKYENNN